MALFDGGINGAAFLRGDVREVVEVLQGWAREMRGADLTWRDAAHAEILEFLSPRAPNPEHAVLFQVSGEWTVFLDSDLRQFCPDAEIWNYTRLSGKESYFFGCWDASSESLEACQMRSHRLVDGEIRTRHVVCEADGRMHFDAQGDPLPFENLDAYRSRRKRDRFNPQILSAYMQSLGIPAVLFGPARPTAFQSWDKRGIGRVDVVELTSQFFGTPTAALGHAGKPKPVSWLDRVRNWWRR